MECTIEDLIGVVEGKRNELQQIKNEDTFKNRVGDLLKKEGIYSISSLIKIKLPPCSYEHDRVSDDLVNLEVRVANLIREMVDSGNCDKASDILNLTKEY